MEKKYFLQNVGNTVEIFNILEKQRKPLSITEIANLTGIGRSIVNRIVYTLYSCGYLTKQNKKYYFSNIFVLFNYAYSEHFDVLDIIAEEMQLISEKYGETTFLFTEVNGNCVMVDFYEPKGAEYPKEYISETAPYNCTSIGKVFLSAHSDDVISSFMEKKGFFKSTEKSICNIKDLLDEIHFVQKNGYALCIGELTLETGAVGIPIYGAGDKIAFVISFSYGKSMTIERLDEIIPGLLQSSKKLSKIISSMNLSTNN